MVYLKCNRNCFKFSLTAFSTWQDTSIRILYSLDLVLQRTKDIEFTGKPCKLCLFSTVLQIFLLLIELLILKLTEHCIITHFLSETLFTFRMNVRTYQIDIIFYFKLFYYVRKVLFTFFAIYDKSIILRYIN